MHIAPPAPASLTLHHQALTTKILNLVQQAANYKQLRKVIHILLNSEVFPYCST